MKFSATQENLVKGLQIVNRVATTRSTLPILGNILLLTDKGRLKLATTDLEIAITTHIGAKVDNEGAITVPARTLSEFVTNNHDTTIDFNLNDTLLEAKSAHVSVEIKGIDAQEFPTIPTLEKPEFTEVPALALREAISQTVFATTQDETRPVLSGVALFIKDQEIKLVATDSFRLAEKKIIVPKGQKGIEAIIPARAMLELARLITDNIAQVSLCLTKHQLVAVCGETHLTSRLIEGGFPPYESIIPNDLPTTVTVNRHEFVAALKMASLFSRDSAYNVTFNVSDKELTLKALSSQIGTSLSRVTAATAGEALTMAFNAKFILDALAVISSEAVQFRLKPPTANTWFPGVIQSTEDLDYRYVIMPLRTEA